MVHTKSSVVCKFKKWKLFLIISITAFAGGMYMYSECTNVDIYAIEHGATQVNNLHSENNQTLLSVEGLQQANDLGDIISNITPKIEVIYSSPVECSRTMASIIATKVHGKLVVDNRISSNANLINSERDDKIAKQVQKDHIVQQSKNNKDSTDSEIMIFLDKELGHCSKSMYFVTEDEVIKSMYKHANVPERKLEPSSVSIFKYNIFTKTLSFKEYRTIDSIKATSNTKEVANAAAKSSNTKTNSSVEKEKLSDSAENNEQVNEVKAIKNDKDIED